MATLKTLGSTAHDSTLLSCKTPLLASPGAPATGILTAALPLISAAGPSQPAPIVSAHGNVGSGDRPCELVAAATVQKPDQDSSMVPLLGEEEQCSGQAAAEITADALQPSRAPTDRRGQSSSDAEDSNTPHVSDTTEPTAASVSAVSTPQPTASPVSSVQLLTRGLVPYQQMQLLQLQHFVKQQTHLQLHTAMPFLALAQAQAPLGAQNARADGTSTASQQNSGARAQAVLGDAVAASSTPSGAVATASLAGRSRGRPPRVTGRRTSGGSKEPQKPAEKAGTGGSSGRGRGKMRRAITAYRQQCEVSDDCEEPDEYSELSSEEAEQQTDEHDSDYDDERGQTEDPMPGCHHCGFAENGCDDCRTRPFVSRPFARWRPEKGRFQEGVPSAPVYHPTPEEFEDPLAYIAKIRPEAESYGICKIMPPASYSNPAFTLASGGKNGTASTGRNRFRFEVCSQLTSHLCMRPCGSDLEPQKGAAQPPAGPGAPGETQLPPALSDGRLAWERTSGADSLPGTRDRLIRTQADAVRRHQSTAAQGADNTGLIRHKQQQQQQGLPASASAAALCSFSHAQRSGQSGSSGHLGSSSGIRIVAPSTRPSPRAPGAAVESSLERYVTGLRAHPLLGLDEAAAAAAAAALSTAAAAARSGGQPLSNTRRVSDGGGSGVGTGNEISGKAVVSQQRQGGRMARPRGTVESEDGNHLGSAGSVSDSDSDEFGFTSTGRMHTLRSFRAYCHWARCLHFDLPPYGDRFRRHLQACERTASGSLPAAGNRASRTATATAGAAGSSSPANAPPVSPSPSLPLLVQAAIAHAAEGREPTAEEVEAEFWRLVERPKADAVVETLCACNLDPTKLGCGFPPPSCRGREQLPGAQGPAVGYGAQQESLRYADHPWNLHSIPRGPGSLLRCLEPDELMPGVMIPSLSVGSCLSACCWRMEDLGLYSAHYLHAGAEKVWYGVPAHAADQFEAAMRDAVPHLFAADPLLLHRPVTHMSPTELRRRGVTVCRLVQEPGSFVITFPGAHHSGISCGFNLTGAVNFATADWLPHGSDIAHKYREQGRRCALSHDRLLLRLVSMAVAGRGWRQGAAGFLPEPEEQVALAVSAEQQCGKEEGANQVSVGQSEAPAAAVCAAIGELSLRLEEETQLRGAARRYGIIQEQLVAGPAGSKEAEPALACMPDTVCMSCKRDLYLSAVVRRDVLGAATCPQHASELGAAPEHCVLLARHSLEQLRGLLDAAVALFPGALPAVVAAKHRRAQPRQVAIRRLGPISKYGIPYSSPLDERDASNAALGVVGGAGGLAGTSQPYVPYDPEAASDSDPEGTPRGRLGGVRAEGGTGRDALLSSAAESGKTSSAEALAEERERLGPRQALVLGEQQAEAERREEQRRVQEDMKLARAQRAARRHGAGGAPSAPAPFASQPPRTAPAPIPLEATSALAMMPAVAVIAPTPGRVPKTPVVRTSTDMTMPPLAPLPQLVPAVAISAVPPLAVPPVVVQSAAPPRVTCAGDPASPVQGVKRSNRGVNSPVASPPAALDGDRAVRPRRERRVPKHLLDAEMELADEMQQVVAGAAAGGGAAAGLSPAEGITPTAASGDPPAAVAAAGKVATAGAATAARVPRGGLQHQPSSSSIQQVECGLIQQPSVGSDQQLTAGAAPPNDPPASGHVPAAVPTPLDRGSAGTAAVYETTASREVSPSQQGPQGIRALAKDYPQDQPPSQQPHQQESEDRAQSTWTQPEQPQQPTDKASAPASGADAPAKPLASAPAVPAAAVADDMGMSPRRSSRATRPSVRLMEVAAMGPAAVPGPAPGVLLLKRETTSGPSTSMRAGGAAARRLSVSIALSAPAGLPPTTPAAGGSGSGPAASAAAAPALPPSIKPAGTTQAPVGPAAVSAGSPAQLLGAQVRMASADSGTAGLREDDMARSAAAAAPSQQPASVVPGGTQPQGGVAGGPKPSPQTQPPVHHQPQPVPTLPLTQVGTPVGQTFEDTEQPSPFAALASAQSLQLPATVASEPEAVLQLPTRVASAPMGSLQPQPQSQPQGQDDANQQQVWTPGLAGRPVRKRRTTLSHDMVIYGESAALFGAGAVGPGAKRKAGADRRSQGSGGGAAAADGRGENEELMAAHLPTDDDADEVVGGITDDRDSSLVSFGDDLRPLAAGMSPSHVLFADLRCAASPSPMPLSTPLRLPMTMSLGDLEAAAAGGPMPSHGRADGFRNAAAAVRSAGGGPGGQLAGLGAGAALHADMEEEDACVTPAHAPQSPGLLELHDHDHEHDVFMADAGPPLALSASPSANGLDTMSVLHASFGGGGGCGDGSPRVPAAAHAFSHLDAGGSGLAGPSAGQATAVAASVEGGQAGGAMVLSDMTGPKRSGDALASPGLPQAGQPGKQGVGWEVVVGGGPGWMVGFGTQSGQCGVEAAPASSQPASLQGWPVPAQAAPVPSLGHVMGTALGVSFPAATVAEIGLVSGSRQGLSSLAGGAAGEWADLDDLVTL